MSLEEMYTEQEVCQAIRIGRSTMARWREQGLITYIKLPNGQIRYLASHVRALHQYARQGSAPPFQESSNLDSHIEM